MAGWLPLYVRRVIAILLLVLDVGLEPGSALSFVGISDPDDGEAVADLCRQDDFWWERKCAPVVLAKTFASEVTDYHGGFRRGTVTKFASAQLPADHPAIVLADVEGSGWAVGALCELAPCPNGSPVLDGRALLRNSYIAQKRLIVLLT
jgi:hypothetical protein